MAINQLLGYLLLVVLLAPLAFAGIIGLTARTRAATARALAVYGSALHVLLTVVLVALYSGFSGQSESSLGLNPKIVAGDAGVPGDPTTFSRTTGWNIVSFSPNGQALPAIQFFVGLDGMNVLLVALTSAMFFFSVLVSWGTVTERPGAYYAWLFVLQTAVTGAFLSFDIILFYIFFELTLIPSFFLIGQFGTGGARRDAAKKFVLYTLFGSLFTLVGIVGIVLTNPIPMHPTKNHEIYYEPSQEAIMGRVQEDKNVAHPKPGLITFSIPTLVRNVSIWDSEAQHSVSYAQARLNRATPDQRPMRVKDLAEAKEHQGQRRSIQFWLFLALMAGFAVKVPIVPFHTWLPAAYGEAPLAVTMIFSAVLAKLGTFGILRVVIPLVPEMCVQYGLTWFGTLGAIGIVYTAFCAYAQRDLKLLAAYSSVSHLGFLIIGLFAMNPEGLSGAILHMVNHGLTAGALFALLVFLSKRYRTLDANQLGGLWAKYPRYAFFLIFIALASVGLPGLNNFVSEMLMLAGLFDYRNLKLVGYSLPIVAAIGVLLSSWYTMTMIRRVLFGKLLEPPTANSTEPPQGDLSGHEFVPAAAMAALCLGIGLFPQPLLDIMKSDVDGLSSLVSRARYRLDPTALPPEWKLPKTQRERPLTAREQGPQLAPAPREVPANR